MSHNDCPHCAHQSYDEAEAFRNIGPGQVMPMSDTRTLRDWLAGMALNGLCSDLKHWEAAQTKGIAKQFTEMSYVLADAMLKERERE